MNKRFSIRRGLFGCIAFVAGVGIIATGIGCGGSGGTGGTGGTGGAGGNTATNPYVNLSYQGSGLALGASGQGSLTLTIGKTTLGGSLVVTSGTAAGTYGISGGFTGSSANFTGTLTGPASASLSGTLPSAPATTGGSFSVTVGGTTYGPFVFQAPSPSYTVSLINFQGNDLNDNGEVVGGAEDASGVGHAFMWTKAGGSVDLGTFGSKLSASALAVNNGGVIAGQIMQNNGGQNIFVPFVLGAGAQLPGLPPNCDDVTVFGVTNAGQLMVNGYLSNLGIEEGVGCFILNGGTYTAIGETTGGGQANGLNFFNRYSNTAYGSLSSTNSQQVTRWEWNAGNTTVVDWSTILSAVSASSYYTGGANGEWLGTLKNGDAGFVSANGGTVTDLGHVGTVYGLNASGQAVGNYSDASGHQFGFYWTKATGFVQLSTLIDPSLKIAIQAATRINASGQILCQAQTGQAGLLTPK